MMESKKPSEFFPSPIPFFTFGFFYYLVIPVLIYYFFPLNNKLLSVGTSYYHDDFFNKYYFFDLILIFFSFYFSFLFFSNLKVESFISIDRFSSLKLGPKILSFILIIFFLLLIIKAKLSGISFFSGYSSYEIQILGPLVSFVFLNCWFYIYFLNYPVRKVFIFIFILSSLVILGLGSRMFFVLGIISIGISKIHKNPRLIQSAKFKLVGSFLVSLVLFIGVWRDGSNVNLNQILGVLFAEPYFTMASATSYFQNIEVRPIYGDFKDVAASVVNFLPSLFFPSKIEYIKTITFNNNKYSPFGASSIIVNLYSNFGYFYPIYLIFIGGFYGLLFKFSQRSNFMRAVYFSILPLLMFHFFREGFITVFKVMFYNALILPFIIIIVLKFIVIKKR